jgi:hypothetical protein
MLISRRHVRVLLVGLFVLISGALSGQSPAEITAAKCPCSSNVKAALLSGVSVLQLSGSLLEARAILRSKGTPPQSLRAHGTVKVHIVTNTAGYVVCASAVTGHPLLRGPAENAAKKWRFAPLTADGHPVALEGEVPIFFEN